MMTRFNCLITGDDYQMVRQESAGSRKKINLLASSVWIPVMMWFSTSFLLSTQVMNKTVSVAVIVAMFVSAIIFMIERSIVMSNGNKMLYVFRIILGFLVASLGSLALDEVLFKNDIDMKMDEILTVLKKNTLTEIENRYSEILKKQEKNVAENKIKWQECLEIARQEADGTGGSHQRGVSAITKLKLSQANELKNNYSQSEYQLIKLKEKIDAEKNQEIKEVEKAFNHHSLLTRIKAMFMLITSDLAMGLVYFLITLMLFCLEFIVVILKITYPKTSYELKLEAIEKIAAHKIQSILEHDTKFFRPEMNDARVKEVKHLLNCNRFTIFN